MNSHSRFNSFYAVVALGLAALLASAFAAGQNCPDNPGVRTICEKIGSAEVVSVSGPFGAYPATPPTVYWHDADWWIDVLPKLADDGRIRVQIKSRNGETKIAEFDAVLFAQVDSITRGPRDKAIVIGEPNGTSSSFGILDLRAGEEISGGLLYRPSISPDRRFLLYESWYPPHEGGENQYILYDLLRTSEENTCGFWDHDPKRRSLADEGIQVYPHAANHIECELEDEDDDNRAASGFIWSSDSSKVVFADIKSGIISLILVTMPGDKGNGENNDRGGMDSHSTERVWNHLPQTSIYTFIGAENVCAGAASCDNNNVRSVAWNGDSINVALIQANPGGAAIEKDLTIPLSKFVPVSNGESPTPHREHP